MESYGTYMRVVYVARVPGLDNIAGAGPSEKEALENLLWALRGVKAEDPDQTRRALAAALLESVPIHSRS